MERIRDTKSSGITAAALRTWGMVFLAMGIVATGILQNRLLRLGEVSPGQLLQAMQSSDSVMAFATLALVLRAVATCAVPIFALLLVEGARHTGSFRNYFLRVAGLALLSEIPYNLAISGRVLDLTTRNPAFSAWLRTADSSSREAAPHSSSTKMMRPAMALAVSSNRTGPRSVMAERKRA